MHCPINVTLSVIAGKWKPLILFQLKRGPCRFSRLQSALPQVSHKVLTQQIRQLQSSGLIERSVLAGGRGSSYALTDFGRTLRPLLADLARWGTRNAERLEIEFTPPVV
jgi:DNA-binding HxlR family transcriptional regulator